MTDWTPLFYNRSTPLLKGLHFVKAINAIIALLLKNNRNRLLKGTGAKRDVCRRFLGEYSGKLPGLPGGVCADPMAGSGTGLG